tara:strand:- start:471 stop:620 length:150 start_codon:yes stop_codon:yes gene_type:complete
MEIIPIFNRKNLIFTGYVNKETLFCLNIACFQFDKWYSYAHLHLKTQFS